MRLRIGFTNGCFDLFHSGHLSTLRLAAAHCDKLIVGVDSDAAVRAAKGPDRPIVPASERAALIEALRMVDAVVIFDAEDLDPLIAGIAPEVLIKGDEYIGKTIVGAEHADKIIYAPMVQGLSTTSRMGSL